MYAVYDIKDNEICVGIFDKCKDVAKYFNSTEKAIYSDVCKKQIRAKRYKIVRIKENKE